MAKRGEALHRHEVARSSEDSDWLEPPTAEIGRWLSQRGIQPGPDTPCLVASYDLGADGRPGHGWVICTADALWLVPQGPPEAATAGGGPTAAKSVRSWPLRQVEGIALENLVGNGLLVAKVQLAGDRRPAGTTDSAISSATPLSPAEEQVICRFSSSQARKFGLFVRLAEKLRKAEELTESDRHPEAVNRRCPTCGRFYPEPNRTVCPHCLDRRALFVRVLSFMPRYRWAIGAVLACMVASSLLRVLNPYLGGRIFFDEALRPEGRYFGQLGLVVLTLFGSQLLALLISIVYGRINAGLSAQVVYDLKTEVFSAMQRLSLRFFTAKETGNLMTRVNSDAMTLQYFFHDGFPYFIVNVLQLGGILGVMLLLNWRLTLLTLMPVPLVAIAYRLVFPRLYRLWDRMFHKSSALNSLINDVLSGVRVVKAFGREAAEAERFGTRSRDLYAVSVRLGTLEATVFPMVSLLMSLGSLVVWGAGGWDVITGEITFGTLMTFTGYLGMLYGPLDFLTQVADWWTHCMNSAQRMFEVMDAVPEVVDAPYPVHLRLQGAIELQDVAFGYEPHKPVLHSINLKVEPGEMLGLVGHSGAGKSTITNLITRLYDVDQGLVKIDGQPVGNLALADLRAQIGMVLQDTFLFAGSIWENIAYAVPQAEREAVVRAAKAANAHEFIVTELPDGYDTLLGRRGRDLSGGEKQRIAIARAILRDPRILILDEATSSVDTQTESRIQEALRRLVRDRTTVAIAHRLSTLREASRLYVLEQGKNVEEGTHEELVAKQGAYYKLLQAQREALKIRGVDDQMLTEAEQAAVAPVDAMLGSSPPGLPDYTEVNYLDATELEFRQTPGGFLALDWHRRSSGGCAAQQSLATGSALPGTSERAGESAQTPTSHLSSVVAAALPSAVGPTAVATTAAAATATAADSGLVTYAKVSVYRCFPLSQPDEFISVRDEKGDEIGIIRRLAQLRPKQRQLVAQELARRYFAPVVRRVRTAKEQAGYSYWEVETDRGQRRFIMRHSHENVLPVDDRQVILLDVDGNRFMIPDYQTLLPAAFRLLETIL